MTFCSSLDASSIPSLQNLIHTRIDIRRSTSITIWSLVRSSIEIVCHFSIELICSLSFWTTSTFSTFGTYSTSSNNLPTTSRTSGWLLICLAFLGSSRLRLSSCRFSSTDRWLACIGNEMEGHLHNTVSQTLGSSVPDIGTFSIYNNLNLEDLVSAVLIMRTNDFLVPSLVCLRLEHRYWPRELYWRLPAWKRWSLLVLG